MQGRSMDGEAQHVYHHYDNDGARVNVSFEQNSRGVNFSATVTGAKTVEEGIRLLVEARKALEQQFTTDKGDK